MDAIVVGIDVSKNRLDVAVRPTGEVFAVVRDAEGLDALVARLKPLAPVAVALRRPAGTRRWWRRASRRRTCPSWW